MLLCQCQIQILPLYYSLQHNSLVLLLPKSIYEGKCNLIKNVLRNVLHQPSQWSSHVNYHK